jgi:hypothetical protein
LLELGVRKIYCLTVVKTERDKNMKLIESRLSGCARRKSKPFIKRMPALLLAFTISIYASTSAFAQSFTVDGVDSSTEDPSDIVCKGAIVFISVTPTCTDENDPSASVAGATGDPDDIALISDGNGNWTNSYTASSAGTFTVSASDNCGESFDDVTLTVVELDDINIYSSPADSGWLHIYGDANRDYAILKSPAAGDVVIFGLDITPNTTEAATKVTWCSAVTPWSDNMTATFPVDSVSGPTAVTASACDCTTSPYTVWVFWGQTPTYQFSSTTPANAQALWSQIDPSGSNGSHLMWWMPGIDLGFQVYPDMTHSSPTFSVPGTNGYSKVCITVNLQPAGIGALIGNGISDGWKMIQKKWCHEFSDSSPSSNPDYYSSDWTDDGFYDWRNTHTPDSGDNLYGIEGPGCGKISGGTSKYEVHQNFQDYETLDGVIVSDLGYWKNEASWIAGPPQAVNSHTLTSGSITPLPTSAQY